jgi:hypothetical protein
MTMKAAKPMPRKSVAKKAAAKKPAMKFKDGGSVPPKPKQPTGAKTLKGSSGMAGKAARALSGRGKQLEDKMKELGI